MPLSWAIRVACTGAVLRRSRATIVANGTASFRQTSIRQGKRAGCPLPHHTRFRHRHGYCLTRHGSIGERCFRSFQLQKQSHRQRSGAQRPARSVSTIFKGERHTMGNRHVTGTAGAVLLAFLSAHAQAQIQPQSVIPVAPFDDRPYVSF